MQPAEPAPHATRPPNILLIVSDDLGVGELGCYGQERIRTPNLDALAASGVRFEQAYSGSCVCAPSRCTLLTGFHTGHAAIRDNKELAPEGQEPLPPDSVTIAELLHARGYATGAIGKWGLGPPGSPGDPASQGFDSFFGYLCQRHAHNHCPSFLYRDGARVELPGNAERPANGVVTGGVYAPDLFRDEALAFVDAHAGAPFFLMFATPVPHLALQAPEDAIAAYRDSIPDAPYDGSKGYLAHPEPRRAYAAMVSRMDADVGAILARLELRGIADDTLVIFTSDNGPTYTGGSDSAFFESAAGRRGLKGQLYEGGIRVPLIVARPGRVRAGAVSGAVTGNWDLFATIASAAGIEAGALPAGLDGIDLTPELTGEGALTPRDALYWEYPAGKGWQAARLGDWKAVRRNAKQSPPGAIELYDLATDPTESRDVSLQQPEVLTRIEAIFGSRTTSPIREWNYAP